MLVQRRVNRRQPDASQLVAAAVRLVTAAAIAAHGFGSTTGASEPSATGTPEAASAPAGYRWGSMLSGTVSMYRSPS